MVFTRCLASRGNNLSVGQKQLLALARVLVETPQILILMRQPPALTPGLNRRFNMLWRRCEHTTLVVLLTAYRLLLMPTPFWCFNVGEAVEQGTHQQPLAARDDTGRCINATCGRELAASVREGIIEHLNKRNISSLVQKCNALCTVIVRFHFNLLNFLLSFSFSFHGTPLAIPFFVWRTITEF